MFRVKIRVRDRVRVRFGVRDRIKVRVRVRVSLGLLRYINLLKSKYLTLVRCLKVFRKTKNGFKVLR